MKVILTEQQKKNLLEYVTTDIINLKDYLTMSKEQKIENLPHEYIDYVEFWLEEYPLEIGSMTVHEFVEDIEYNNPKAYQDFGKWLYKRISNDSLDISDEEYPAWHYLTAPEVIKNQWLIHFTGDAEKIAKEGFKLGVNEFHKLGLTTRLGEFEKMDGGYNFAFLLKDYYDYSYEGLNEFKYGTEAVVFRASGIKIFHEADYEPQVIFYGKTAKNIIPITGGDKGHWAIKNKFSSEIYREDDDLTIVVDWLTQNYPQYRKHLT